MAGRKRMVLLVTALVATSVLVSLSLSACGSKDITPPTQQIDIAKDVAMKTEILAIQTGIDSYIASNGEAPPTADQNTLGAFVQPWPQNPYTKVPMKPGENPGEYTYSSLGGANYQLIAHLSGGVDYRRH